VGKNILAAIAALFGYLVLDFAALAILPPWGERLVLAVVAALLGLFGRNWSWLKVLLFALMAAGLEILGIYLGTRDPLRQAGVHAQVILNEMMKKSANTLLMVVATVVVAATVGYLLRKLVSGGSAGNRTAAP
jgi:hypothetical protein